MVLVKENHTLNIVITLLIKPTSFNLLVYVDADSGDKMKHIFEDYYFIQKQIQLGILYISHVFVKCELNYILTKP